MFASTKIESNYQQHQIWMRNGQAAQVRPFPYTDDAYRQVVAIHNAIDPESPDSVANWKHWDQNREEKYLFRRYVAEMKGKIVAVGTYGHTAWSYKAHKYFITVMVLPDMQGKGIGSRLYTFLERKLARLQPAKLVSFTRENRPEAVRFLEKRGFRQEMREEVSRLESADFDASRYAEKLARVRAGGIEVKTLSALMTEDPDWKRKVYDLEWECLQDVPTTDPLTRRSPEAFEKQTLQNPCLLPDAWFIAVDGERYVGLSVLWRNLATDSLLQTGLTGVVRSHRRRGIATAMKVKAIAYAQAHGNAAIDTDNEENNPMFQLNLDLGFRPLPGFLDYAKEVGPAAEKRLTGNSQSPV